MAQEDPNRLAEWVLVVREKVPEWKSQLVTWFSECCAEPALFWETNAVRYTAYAIGAIVLIVGFKTTVTLFAPAPVAEARPEATTADFHVICSDRSCGHHFAINRPFGFSGFPVLCPQCQHESGARAVRCMSPTCRGRWVPVGEDQRARCPECGAMLPVGE